MDGRGENVCESYLQHVVAELEHNDMLHAEILLYPFHALLAANILERVCVLAIEPVHNIPLEMLEQVHFAFKLLGVNLNGVRLTHIDRAGTA